MRRQDRRVTPGPIRRDSRFPDGYRRFQTRPKARIGVHMHYRPPSSASSTDTPGAHTASRGRSHFPQCIDPACGFTFLRSCTVSEPGVVFCQSLISSNHLAAHCEGGHLDGGSRLSREGSSKRGRTRSGPGEQPAVAIGILVTTTARVDTPQWVSGIHPLDTRVFVGFSISSRIMCLGERAAH